MSPRITHVAIRFRGVTYSMPAPKRHHHIIRHIVETTDAKTVDSRGEDQGFLDDTGRYLTRDEGLVLALESGQVKSEADLIGSILTSEDLW